MTQVPAGWYPSGDGQMRYWDGQNWTQQTAPAQPGGSAPSAPSIPGGSGNQGEPIQQYAPAQQFPGADGAQGGGGSKNGVKIAIIAAGLVVLLIIGLAIALLLSGGSKGSAQETADRFMDAFLSGNCDGMLAEASESFVDDFGSEDDFCSYWDDYVDVEARKVLDESETDIGDSRARIYYDVETIFDGEWSYDIWYRITVDVVDGTWQVTDLY